MNEEIKNEIIEEETQATEENEVVTVEPEVKEEVQEVAEATEETDKEEEVVEEHKEGVENDNNEAEAEQEGDKADVPEVEEKPEEVKEPVVEEVEEENIEDVKRELEELKFDKEETKAVEDYKKLIVEVNKELEEYEDVIQNALSEGLKHFGIDATKTIDELRAEDASKAIMAEQLVKAAQERLMQKRAELETKTITAENDLVFKRAEREIERYGLTNEQKTEAAKTFVNILTQVGINDLDVDLKAKVKLAVAQAKMDIPADVQKAVEEIKSDTTVSEMPTVEIEKEPDSKVEEKVEVPPTPVEEVDMDSFTESATEGKANGVASINEENVLERMASLPFKERTAFYREHIDLINEVMRKRR